MRIELRTVGLPLSGAPSESNAEISTDTDQKALEVDLPDGATVGDLLERASELGVPADQVERILLDGAGVDQSTRLHDGAAVTLFGQVHGV
jgi:hypothetical protein